MSDDAMAAAGVRITADYTVALGRERDEAIARAERAEAERDARAKGHAERVAILEAYGTRMYEDAERAEAQLAALREAVIVSREVAPLWNTPVSSGEEFASAMEALTSAETSLCAALADAAPAAEAYSRRVRAEALREAAGTGRRAISTAWLRARADEIERG